ncbi:hypothetical protein BJX76DRAFT_216171 [Aspergillus varians]
MGYPPIRLPGRLAACFTQFSDKHVSHPCFAGNHQGRKHRGTRPSPRIPRSLSLSENKDKETYSELPPNLSKALPSESNTWIVFSVKAWGCAEWLLYRYKLSIHRRSSRESPLLRLPHHSWNIVSHVGLGSWIHARMIYLWSLCIISGLWAHYFSGSLG